jgi:hypothetical protein
VKEPPPLGVLRDEKNTVTIAATLSNKPILLGREQLRDEAAIIPSFGVRFGGRNQLGDGGGS